MNSANDKLTGRTGETDPAESWDHFLRTGLVFLVFEAVIIFIAGGPVSGPADSTLWFFVIAGLGGIGYLLLGVRTGAWLSVIFIPLPIVLAVAVGGTVADGSSASEAPLYVSWTFLSLYFFTPAWLLGLLISSLHRRHPDGR